MNIDTRDMEEQPNNQSNKDQEVTIDGATKIKQIHSNIPDEEIPKVSMEFETEEQAYNFYNVYAYKVGFSIRRSKGHKDNKDGKVKDRTFCCSCEGFRKKDKRYDNVKCHRAETRFGCLARMKIKLHQFGNYQVVEFYADHTHMTSSPSKSHLHRSQRRITLAQASEIDLAENSGIAPKATAMSRKKPKTILTDQDAAMAKALRSQWPETYHRLCIWHMYQNAAKHLSSVFERFHEFATGFENYIYEYDEECEFIEAWGNMLGYQHTLLRFFKHFERLIDDRRYEELKVDFRVSQRNLAPSLPIEILNHATYVYTPVVLRMFEVEFSKAYNCAMEFCTELGAVAEYKLTPNGKYFHHTVKYDSSIDGAICSCKKFEFAGILCSHILKVFSFRNVLKIPSQYILKRWTKHAKMGATGTFEIKQGDDLKACLAMRYQDLSRSYTHIVTRASETEKAYKVARNGFKRLWDDVDACLREERIESKEESHTTFGIDTTVKGIKTKNKRICGSSSCPKNSLEKMCKKTKVSPNFNNNDQVNNYMPHSQPDLSFSTTSFNLNHIGMTPKNSSIGTSMAELLLQTESTSFGFEGSQFFKNI
ncbi:protein FAR1-RELATED SEQUENCE 12-like [Humulus lupulus]|uniref:protein FAR1-RELATED SEQUENCE 12-like n=1 Tax=Humulus lupulus TaxID=3486 RepID=UPI002B40A99E|nr:protein FAR1-RELATED SEQUENCE 12-like [Humulus lupulus]